jgi:hypothetical protein
MGRLIVLCLVFLSLLSFPGHACAIITGELWFTNALSSALNPASGPPKDPAGNPTSPDATFNVSDINFDSRLYPIQPGQPGLSYNQFLNITDSSPNQWTSGVPLPLDPSKSMFSSIATNPNRPDQGIFFRFTMLLDIPAGLLPFTVFNNDGFYVFTSDGQIRNYSDQVLTDTPAKPDPPIVFDYRNAGGEYLFTIYYGALNDTANHVLIFRTPEPGTLLLLGLGLIGIGISRGRRP